MHSDIRQPLRRALLDVGVFSAAINLLMLAAPLYMLQVYDRVLSSSSFDTLFYITVIAIVAVVVMGFLEGIRALYANRVAARLDVAYGPPLFKASMVGPRAALGDVQPLRDLATIRVFTSSRALFFLFDVPFAPLFIALLYFVHPVIFWATLGCGVAMVLIAMANQWATARSSRESGEAQAAAMTLAQTYARNYETIRTLGMHSGASSQWAGHFSRAVSAADRLVSVNTGFGSLTRSIRLLQQVAIYGIGAYLTLRGEMTAGMIFAAAMVSTRALQPMDQIVSSWKQIIDARGAWKRVSSLLAATAAAHNETIDLAPAQLFIAAENLVYLPPNARDGAQPLIKRISFRVDAGQALAIIGPSQAGKSTVARLLVGAIEPRSGHVRFDGAELRAWDPERLGANIGYLAQDVELFPGTIAQNIARFDPNAASEEIVAAAERAHVHAMVLAQRDGYDTLIGPAGVRLSGGERQRIGLARALFRDPRLLVLDEPNSNLDSEGEAALERALHDAKERGAMVVVVTHRPSIAARCERVMVLRDGQIEQLGPAQDVLRRLTGQPPAERQPKGEVVPMPGVRTTPVGGQQVDVAVTL